METVMSVGLRLCALEFTREQLQPLSYLAVTGLLPDSFPRAMWVQAVRRSFSSQEAGTCVDRDEWDETRQVLALVDTAIYSLWFRLMGQLYGLGVLPPCPDGDFPLRILVHLES